MPVDALQAADAHGDGHHDVEEEGDGSQGLGTSPHKHSSSNSSGLQGWAGEDGAGGVGHGSSGVGGGAGGVDSPLLPLLLPQGLPPVPRPLDIRSNPRMCDLYVELACKHEPLAVMPFLLRNHAYDVRRCLTAVTAAGVRDASALLRERLGQLEEALELYLQAVTEWVFCGT